jgi:hypothetical protein
MRDPMEDLVVTAYCTPVAVQLKEAGLGTNGGIVVGTLGLVSSICLDVFARFCDGVCIDAPNTASNKSFDSGPLSCHLTTQDGPRLLVRHHFLDE